MAFVQTIILTISAVQFISSYSFELLYLLSTYMHALDILISSGIIHMYIP